jgi:hypothetical protein
MNNANIVDFSKSGFKGLVEKVVLGVQKLVGAKRKSR